MEKWFGRWNKSKLNVFLSSKVKAASHCGTLMHRYDCINGIMVCTPSSHVFISHAAIQWRKNFVQLIIHKSMDHLKTAYVALCPQPPAKTFAFFFGSISLSESSFFFFFPSVSSSLVSFFPVFFHFCRQPFCPFLFSPAILVHAEHSAMRQCRPTPPIIVPRGSAHPTPPTWTQQWQSTILKTTYLQYAKGERFFFFSLSLFPFPSLKGCLRCQLLSNMLSELAVWKR